MATQSPPKPGSHPDLGGTTWERFVKSKPNDPRVHQAEAAAGAQNFALFQAIVYSIDPASKPHELYKEIQPHHEEVTETEHPQEHEANERTEQSHEPSRNTSSEDGEKVGEFLSLFKKEPKFMEEDPEFWEIQKRVAEKWREENPQPSQNAPEETQLTYEQKQADFLYGSLDDPQSPSLDKLATKEFKEEHTKKDVSPKELEKWNRYVVYKNTPTTFDKDDEVKHVKESIFHEGEARKALLQKSGLKGSDLDQSYKAVMERIRQKKWDEFAETHEKKAQLYAQESFEDKKMHPDIKEDFTAFKKAHEALLKKQDEAVTKTAETLVQKPSAPLPQATDKMADIPNLSPVETKPLSEEEKLNQDLAALKQQMAEKKAVAAKTETIPIVSPTNGKLSSNNPISYQIGKHSSDHEHAAPQKNTGPSQGQTRPQSDTMQHRHIPQLPMPSAGQVRPSASLPGFRFPKWRSPRTRSPLSFRPSLRTGGLDRISSGLSNGLNALQTGANTLKTIESLASGVKTAALFLNPAMISAIVIGVFVLLFVLIFLGVFASFPSFNITTDIPAPAPISTSPPTTISGLTLSLVGPTQVQNSENIQYTINASYTGNAEITLTDTFPTNTTLVSATGTTTKTPTSVSWKLNDNDGGSNDPKTYTFTITLKPEKDDIVVKNKIVASAVGGTGPGANKDTCGGIYPLNNPRGNFGDPTCDFKKDELYSLLKQQDPAQADYWFFKIVPCESGYSPNAYLAASASGEGAYGLFQMNPTGKGNSQFDAGDVYWKMQISNAINQNNLRGGAFGYWACR